MNRSDTIRAHGDALQVCMTGLIPAQPSFLLAPVFPGCHVILSPCDPSRYRTPPSYQASTNEPESNRHFLCWWPEVIPA